MSHSPSFPQFKRPSDAVVYWTLENLCHEQHGPCRITIMALARRCGLSATTVKRVVSWLTAQRLLHYQPGVNQFRPPVFHVPAAKNGRCGQRARQPSGRPKNGRPHPNDSDSDQSKNIIIGDNNDIVGAIRHRQNETGAAQIDESQERLAYRIAEGLDDLKNLALYQTYCRRFPEHLILNAFTRAREPSPDKIRVSRGALFNFLVQLYAKKRRE